MIDRASLDAIWAVAALDLLDGLRSRTQLLVRAFVPLALFALVFGVAFVTRSPSIVRIDEPVVVAVDGDVDGAARTLDALRERGAVVEVTADPVLAASRDADLGVELPDDLDEAMAAGIPVELDVHESVRDRRSTTAEALLQVAMTDVAGPGAATPVRFPVDVVDVQITERGSEANIAGAVPAILCLQAGLITGAVATRLVARRTGGRLVHQLLLPVDRRDVALGKGLAELALGLVTALPIVVPVVIFVAIVQTSRHGALSAIAFVVATVAASVVLSAVMAAAGVLIGSVSRSQEQVTLGSAGAVVWMAVVAAVFALGSSARPDALAVVPVVGIVVSLRNVFAGGGNPLLVVLSLVTTLALAVVIARTAGRGFDAERLVLRES